MGNKCKFIAVAMSMLALASIAFPVKSALGSRNAIGEDSQHNIYDAEVEWLESDGNQYCTTDIVGEDFKDGGMEVRGMPLSLLHTYPVFAGCKPSDSFCILGVHNTQRSLYARISSYGNIFNFTIDYSVFQKTYVMFIGEGQCILLDEENDTQYTKKANTTIVPEKAYSSPLGLFGYGDGYRIMNGRLYYAKVWNENNELIGDFIPVRFTNSNGEMEGAMYDKVSHKLFKNAGSGGFIIGPDKEVE